MRILVCLDGEPHTRGAIQRAIELAASEPAELIGLHVVDEWLRQFSSEIYAQGRREYLEWVDRCLAEQASTVREAFLAQAHAHGVEARCELRDGNPLTEIIAAVEALQPDLVITGGKSLTAWERFLSRKVGERVRNHCRRTTPVETILTPAETPHAVAGQVSVVG